MTFSASGAVEKEKSFVITAEYRLDTYVVGQIRYVFSACGAGLVQTPKGNFNVGSITPQEADGFKLTRIYDWGFTAIASGQQDQTSTCVWVAANKKCILHINGQDYRLDKEDNGEYTTQTLPPVIGIKENEQIKVTYTLL